VFIGRCTDVVQRCLDNGLVLLMMDDDNENEDHVVDLDSAIMYI
jgi:hypothetical protein